MFRKMSLSVSLVVVVLIMEASGLQVWKGCRKDGNLLKFQMTADLQGAEFEYVAFTQNGAEKAGCSSAQEITGTGTAGDPLTVEVIVDSSIDINVGSPDCGHTSLGNALTWNARFVHISPFPNGIGALSTVEMTCNYDQPQTLYAGYPVNPQAQEPGFRHLCNDVDGLLSFSLWIEVPVDDPIQLIVFKKADGTELLNTCSTNGSSDVILQSDSNINNVTYLAETIVNTAVNIQLGNPDCGHEVTMGVAENTLTWRVKVQQQSNVTTEKQFMCPYTPPVTTEPLPPVTTATMPSPAVKFQWICEKKQSLFVMKLFIDLDLLPMDSIKFIVNSTGLELDCDCGTDSGHFLGNGTQNDPFNIRVQVSPDCNINKGTPDCGHTVNVNQLTWIVRVAHSSISGEWTDQTLICDYDAMQEGVPVIFPNPNSS